MTAADAGRSFLTQSKVHSGVLVRDSVCGRSRERSSVLSSAGDESTASHADSWMLKSSTAGSRPSSMADEKPGGRTVNVGMLPAVEGRPLHGGSRPSTGGGIRPGPAGREEGPGGSGRVSVAGAAGSGVSFSVGPALLRSGSFQSSRIIFAPTAPMLDDGGGGGLHRRDVLPYPRPSHGQPGSPPTHALSPHTSTVRQGTDLEPPPGGGGNRGKTHPPPACVAAGAAEQARSAAAAASSSRPHMRVERLLLTADSWTFDVFQLDAATHGRPLSTLAFFLISRSGLIKAFDLPPRKLVRYLVSIENGYSDVNPYHNRKHAADVLQSMHRILHEGGMMATATHAGYVDNLTLLACYLAATVHDYEHGGSTNDFLIANGDQIALTYNDKSPLENHHLSAACKKMCHRDSDFLQHLDKAMFMQLRKMLIDLVMATDMKQHFSIVSQFGALHRLSRSSADSGNGPAQRTSAEAPLSEQPGELGGRDRHSLPLAPPPQRTTRPKVPLDNTERLLSIQMALKLADLGHLSAPLHVHLRWVAALEEEFFRQGDAEKACGLPVSPLFDRTLPGVTKSQVGFFDVVVLPAFKNFSCVFPGSKPMLAAVQANHRHWKSCQLAVVTTDGSSSTSTASLKAGSASSHHLMNFKVPLDPQDPAHPDSPKLHVEVK
ncbi:MAG: hypothetical protein WDW36_008323 [Sanguina aurantia]